MRLATISPAVLVLLAGGTASAAVVPADPSDYQGLLATLQPGDTLELAAGTYTRLTIDGLHGTADAWITIEGPSSGDPAVIVGESCCNTVQLYDSSFVAVRNLTIDVMGLAVDAVNAKDSPSHDILVENNVMQGFPAGGQQIVGVNTKVTVWNWTIRGNRIIEPGTGLYLGGSAGDTPFVAGIIEHNVVVNPVGYCMQIKHQNDYTPLAGMPAGPSRTIVRHNVFMKDDRESPDGDRPSLLVGGFPDAGAGADDVYDVYGNLLLSNPREALFQATGRVAIHDNLLVGGNDVFAALVVTAHQGKSVKLAHVYNNTVYTTGTGISMAQMAEQDDAVVGNLVLAGTPINGTIADERDNLVAAFADAGSYVNAPGVMLGADFYPLAGAVEGTAIDLSKFTDQPEHDRDFNGMSKGGLTFRGAYAGAGDDPCGPLDDMIDECVGGTEDTGGSEGGVDDSGGSEGSAATTADTSGGDMMTTAASTTIGASEATGGGDTSGGASEDEEGGGCGCAAAPGRGEALAGIIIIAAAVRRRRRRFALALIGLAGGCAGPQPSEDDPIGCELPEPCEVVNLQRDPDQS